jgi:hypothetical protein
VIGLGKHSDVRAAFLDMATMVTGLAAHAVKLVPGDNHYTGYCNFCAAGAGGVWLSGNLHIQPIVWPVQF